MTCPEHLSTMALFDGEGDLAAAAAHLESCAECQAAVAGMDEMRQTLRGATYHRAPDETRAAMLRSIAAQRSSPPVLLPDRRVPRFWSGALAGAIAATLVLLFALPRDDDRLADNVTSAHLRAMLPGHLTDLSSPDPQSVARWLSGHTGMAMPVRALSTEGYDLAGARADVIYDKPAAALVYRHAGQVIDVFAWRDDGRALPSSAEESGYRIRFWRDGGRIFCAISTLTAAELAHFAKNFRGTQE